jgi:hypothetical protein
MTKDEAFGKTCQVYSVVEMDGTETWRKHGWKAPLRKAP